LTYLASTAESEPAKRLEALGAALEIGAVSPWVFCLYSLLVVELANDGDRSDAIVGWLEDASSHSAQPGPVALHEATVPAAWWEHYHSLLDTDPGRSFRPSKPTTDDIGRTAVTIESAFGLMAQCDPALHAETGALVRMPVLGAPASSARADCFNGASTFFFWGGALFNAATERSPIAMVDLLVHEASHLLLFGLVEGTALTRNDPSERYDSPLRSDPRPIDGIFHACFVTARVEEAMRRLLASGRLGEEEAVAAEAHRVRNATAARDGLRSLDRHALPTDRGAEIIAALRDHLGMSEAEPT